jgi:hypothetical protein
MRPSHDICFSHVLCCLQVDDVMLQELQDSLLALTDMESNPHKQPVADRITQLQQTLQCVRVRHSLARRRPALAQQNFPLTHCCTHSFCQQLRASQHQSCLMKEPAD